MMVVAAGNAGSGCSTVADPPSFYAASYTVGALNTGTDTIASFSSRGPVTQDGSNRIKPDIAAPGTSTRSATNSSDTAYTTASGTSMATPHIAGAMALLWSAHPELLNNIAASRTALNNSAVFISSTQCGTAGPPNNVYGWGRVDVKPLWAAFCSPAPFLVRRMGPPELSMFLCRSQANRAWNAGQQRRHSHAGLYIYQQRCQRQRQRDRAARATSPEAPPSPATR